MTARAGDRRCVPAPNAAIVVAREDRVATVREDREDARVAPEDVPVALVAPVVLEDNAPEALVVPEDNARVARVDNAPDRERRVVHLARHNLNKNQNQF